MSRWPKRWAREIACTFSPGTQLGSQIATSLAAVRVIAVPTG